MGTSAVVGAASPSDPGANSAYLISAPQFTSGTAPQSLYVIVTNTVTGVSTIGVVAASVLLG